MYCLSPKLVIAVLLCPFALHARPDHGVTQKSDAVEPVPSTQQPPVENKVTITVEGDKRVIVANGVPDHATGRFPNRDNPNKISGQHYRFAVPLKPVALTAPKRFGNQSFGIALNGVVFDPATAEAWQDDMSSDWHYEAKGDAFSLGLDTNNGHVQPNGAYHYHGIPVALLQKLSGGKPGLTLVGWAADGYPIYGKWGHKDPKNVASPVVTLRSSYRLKKGKRPTSDGQPGGTYDGVFVEDFEYVAGSGDLDQCGGRFGPTPEFPAGTYHYVLTEDFPFIPRYFHGQADASFARRGPPPGGREPDGRNNRERRPPPPE